MISDATSSNVFQQFESTDAARDAGYERRNVKAVEVFVVPSEEVVGVMWSSPFAVTVDGGDLFEFIIDWLFREPGELIDLVEGIYAAVAEAQRLEYEINPLFARYIK